MNVKKSKSILSVLTLCLILAACGGRPAAETMPVQIDYDSAVVSYLGPEGTYTQEACGTFFDQRGEYVPYTTVADAVSALTSGESSYCVIPQENTIGGAVIDYVDTLLATENVSVVGEVELPINQNLLVLPGTSLDTIRTVYSHKQGIAQGRVWLEEHLPQAEVIEVSSTAEGARMVAEGGDKSCAAIAAAACADVYGLEILAPAIQNNDRNKTRFYVLSMDAPATATAERLAFVASGDAKDLTALLASMQKQKMTLVTLHDRPRKTELGEYDYLMECADTDYESYVKLSEKSSFEFRYLGAFNVG